MSVVRIVMVAMVSIWVWGIGRRLSWRSGASDVEALGRQPGDEVVPHPMVEWTRATTIKATAAEVWPWLVQMGYGRGGWYTNEGLDQLVWRVSAHSPDELLPQHQALEVGDIIADGPDHAAYFHVRAIERERAIVYYSIRHPYRGSPIPDTTDETLRRMESQLIEGGTYLEFSWSFVLDEQAPGRTRLIVRTRGNYAPGLIGFLRTPLGWVDLFHAHTIFSGVRARAEGSRMSAPTG